jgi:hypothetical protein
MFKNSLFLVKVDEFFSSLVFFLCVSRLKFPLLLPLPFEKTAGIVGAV